MGKAAEAAGNPAVPIGDTRRSMGLPYAGLGQQVADLWQTAQRMHAPEPEGYDYVVNQHGQIVSSAGEPVSNKVLDLEGLAYPAPTAFYPEGLPISEGPSTLGMDMLRNIPTDEAYDILKRDQAQSYFWGEGAPFGAGYFEPSSYPQGEEYRPSPASSVFKPFDLDQQRGSPFLAQTNTVELPDGFRLGGRVRMI